LEIKTISIIGLGALGVMYGLELAKAYPKGAVRFVADKARIVRYQQKGIFCNGKKLEFEFVEPSAKTPPADLLIFAVKSGGLEQAIEDARNQVGPETTLLSLLNGIHSESVLMAAYGAEKILYCVALGMDALRVGNAVRYVESGFLQIGTADGTENERLKVVARCFRRAGLAFEIHPDMPRRVWSKFMLNCGCNQSAMVYKTTYGGLQQAGEARQKMLDAMREVMFVAQNVGVDLSEADIAAWMDVLGRLSPDMCPSMGQDYMARRPSEVDIFGGEVSRLGKKYGVPTPVNDFFVERILAIEGTYTDLSGYR
jgi:2-dehydropantoate 2-reductase